MNLLPFIVAAAAIGWAAWLWLRSHRARRKVRLAADRGYAGELAAAKHLEAAGFEILERHPSTTYTWWLDQETQTAQLQADYRVRRDDEQFLVEVKTGRSARPNLAKIRRQMLEYSMYYNDISGVIFVNGETGQVQMTRFPIPTQPTTSHSAVSLGAVIIAWVIGGLMGWLLTRG